MTGFSGDEYLSFSKPKGINYEPRKRWGKEEENPSPFALSWFLEHDIKSIYNNNVMALCEYFKCPRRKIPALLLLKVAQILVITR